MKQLLRCAVVGVVVLGLSAERVWAQDYPARSVTIVAPSAPGGMYSILARLIAAKLERLYGKSFIVENRPGASSVTGSDRALRPTVGMSGTTSCGLPTSSDRSTTSAAAPRSSASAARSWPSALAPGTQKNRAPGVTLRVS